MSISFHESLTNILGKKFFFNFATGLQSMTTPTTILLLKMVTSQSVVQCRSDSKRLSHQQNMWASVVVGKNCHAKNCIVIPRIHLEWR